VAGSRAAASVANAQVLSFINVLLWDCVFALCLARGAVLVWG
jgi:hypothetical protein